MKKWYIVLIMELSILICLQDFNGNIIISFICIIFHELAHIITASKLGCKFNDFHLNLLGAKAELSNIDELSTRNKLMLFSAGPLFNIIIAIISYILFSKYKLEFIYNCMIINVSLGLFNLLPAYPLDGSRICEILLSKRFLYKKSKRITEICSFIISGALLTIFFIMLSLHKVNISLFLAFILIVYTTILEKKRTMYIIMKDMIIKVRKLKKHSYMENKSISVYYKKGLVNVLTLVDKNKFNSFYILNDEMELLGIIHEDELIKALKYYGNISLDEYVKIRKK